MNEQHYAHLAGVSRSSVITYEAEVPRNSDLYLDVFQFAAKNNMSDPENYAHLENLIDLDSLIDWVFLEGFFANNALTYGNLRFCRSFENDGRWRLMFYDLDATLFKPYLNHSILLHRNSIQCPLVSGLFVDLWANSDFQDRFLSRAAELLRGPLSNKSVLAEIDRLAEQIGPEVARDQAIFNRTYANWSYNVDSLRAFITDNKWAKFNVNSLCKELHLSDEIREKYFRGIR